MNKKIKKFKKSIDTNKKILYYDFSSKTWTKINKEYKESNVSMDYLMNYFFI